MKKVLVVFVMALGMAACNEESTGANKSSDSLRNELDTLGAKISDKAAEVRDSVRAKAGALKEDIEAGFYSAGQKKDSAR